jgi:acyl transferase domain-containing protein/acyl carrier protein
VTRRADEIATWLVHRLADTLVMDASSIDVHEPLASYGLSSRDAVVLSGELEEWLGRSLSATLVWEFPTVEALAQHLSAGDAAPSPAPRAAGSPAPADGIAVVGIGCRFPGADGPAAFWDSLRSGRDAIGEVPADRWDVDAFYDRDPAAPGRTTTRFGGFIPDVDRFDAGFFSVSPREAARMDPQQRILLEVAWEALEHAGLAPDALRGSATGVFVGISTSDYALLQLASPGHVDAYTGTGNAHSIAANRLSYALDLRGPSLAIDTACSSSLVALHLASQSLRSGECRVALAAGVNLLLAPHLTIAFSKAGMMAPDGRCKTFDAAADGYVRGEGCGVVVLKRLSDAIADRDHVLAVIRGSATNQDGLSNGLTAPNGQAQQAVIREALARAGVRPDEIGYVEAHGTGTPLGDPIEFDALREVLMPGRSPALPCAIGSVKTNIGHLEAAAGIAGFIKTVLALHRGEIPPHLHLRELNPHIRLDGTSFTIPTSVVPWRPSGTPRRAGVSAFGFGGTNVHVVLEEAPEPAPPEAPSAGPADLLLVSARTESALTALAARHADHLAASPEQAFHAACATSRTGRSHLAHRLAVTGTSGGQLAARLRAFASGGDGARLTKGHAGSAPKIAFLFTGQGAQYAGMGRELYEAEPVFRRALDRCDDLLRAHLDRPLLSVMWPGDREASLLDRTAYTQPALFALEYALCELWRSVGVAPAAVLGHSVGAFAAACAAGVLKLEDATRVVSARGRLMQSLPPGGAMAAVFADEETVSAVLAPFRADASVAAVNGPAEVVVSGRTTAIEALLASLTQAGVKARRLVVSHAFHSPLMDPILDGLEAACDGTVFGAPQVALVSEVTGNVASEDVVARAGYWRMHARAPVRFAAGMAALRALGCDTFVEIGPGATLVALGRRCVSDGDLTWAASLRKGRDDREEWLGAIGALHVRGASVDWGRLVGTPPPRSVPLPTYPFEPRRHWFEPPPDEARAPRWDTIGSRAQTASAPTEGRAAGYGVAWRTLGAPTPAAIQLPRRWVVASDRGGVATALASALRARGAECLVLPAGTCASDVAGAAMGSDGVVHLAGLHLAADDRASESVVAEMASAACARLLELVQELVKSSAATRLWVVTRNAQAAPDSSRVDVVQGSLWGLGRAVALEHPERWGGVIDVDEGPVARTADALANELLSSSGEDQVAYRGGLRHVARLERRCAPTTRAPVVHPEATYLVTGGLGGIGLELARSLVGAGARHLLLTGRRADRPTPAQSATIAGLRASGAQVRLEPVDASDTAAMTALVAELRRAGPPLRGVFHAAGVVSACPVMGVDAAMLDAALAPKLGGAWALHRLTREVELDSFVLFSSISSVFGSSQLGAYAAANAALDALAQHRAALGLPALTVNWGPWAEVGMTSADDRAALARIGMRALSSRDALAALDRELAGRATQTIVADIDWGTFLPALEAWRERPFFADVRPRNADATAPAQPPFRRRLDSAPQRQRDALLLDLIREQVNCVLGRDAGEALDTTQGFFELGLDSLMAVELKRRLDAALGIELPRSVALEYPNVAALAAHLSRACAAPPAARASNSAAPPDPKPREAEDLLLRELESLDAERNT